MLLKLPEPPVKEPAPIAIFPVVVELEALPNAPFPRAELLTAAALAVAKALCPTIVLFAPVVTESAA